MKYDKKHGFPESYKNNVFLIWIRDRVSAKRLRRMIPEDWGDVVPAEITLRTWIKNDFDPKAAILDRRMEDELEDRLIQEKVEMLQRHGEIGRRMQDKAMAKIDGIELSDLNSNAAVRLLVEGVRIERDSVGVPQALEKIVNASDEDLLERVHKSISKSETEILVIEDSDETD